MSCTKDSPVCYDRAHDPRRCSCPPPPADPHAACVTRTALDLCRAELAAVTAERDQLRLWSDRVFVSVGHLYQGEWATIVERDSLINDAYQNLLHALASPVPK